MSCWAYRKPTGSVLSSVSRIRGFSAVGVGVELDTLAAFSLVTGTVVDPLAFASLASLGGVSGEGTGMLNTSPGNKRVLLYKSERIVCERRCNRCPQVDDVDVFWSP